MAIRIFERSDIYQRSTFEYQVLSKIVKVALAAILTVAALVFFTPIVSIIVGSIIISATINSVRNTNLLAQDYFPPRREPVRRWFFWPFFRPAPQQMPAISSSGSSHYFSSSPVTHARVPVGTGQRTQLIPASSGRQYARVPAGTGQTTPRLMPTSIRAATSRKQKRETAIERQVSDPRISVGSRR